MQAIDFGAGFQSGFNTVDNHFQQNRALDQRDQALAESQRRADQSYALQTEQLDITKQAAIDTKDYRDRTLKMQEEDAAATAQYRAGQLAISATNANIQGSRERRELRAEEYVNLQNRAKAEFGRVVTTGEIDPVFQQEVIDAGYPDLSVNYWAQDQNLNAILALRAPLVAAAKGDYSQVNTPESLAAFNQVYAPQIQVGIGEVSQSNGKKITGKEIAGFKLAPGNTTPDGDQGVVTMLKVSYEDGTSDLQPVTLNRSSATDDNVAINSVGTMLDDVQGRVRMAEIFSRPEVRASMAAAQRTLFGDEAENQDPTKIREIEALVAGGMPRDQAIATVYPQTGGDDAPKIREIEGLMKLGNLSFEAAATLSNTAKTNPTAAVVQLTTELLKGNVLRGEEKEITPDEAKEKAIQMVREINAANYGGGAQSGNPVPDPGAAISEEAGSSAGTSGPSGSGDAIPADTPSAAAPAGLPPAARYKGATVVSKFSGKRFTSDGTNWVAAE